MGYELHITRKPNWFDEGPEITLEEWTALVRSDVELRLDCFAESETTDTHEVIRVEDPSLTVWTTSTKAGRLTSTMTALLADSPSTLSHA